MSGEEEVLESLKKSASKFGDPESLAYGRNFKPNPTDVFITTFPKCGTTWVTQICHQLRSNGDMNFREITAVAPWDTMAKVMGLSLEADQGFSPRLYKSHERFPDIAKGGKYIVVVRDPFDAFVSGYNFLLNIQRRTPEELPMLEFTKVKMGNFSQYYEEWYTAYKNKEADVLVLFYEDLKANAEQEIIKIAKFMNIDEAVFDARVKVALGRSSFTYMQANEDKFSDVLLFEALNKDDSSRKLATTATKVAKGKSGSGKTMSEEVLKVLQEEWDEFIGTPLGFADYAALKLAFQQI